LKTDNFECESCRVTEDDSNDEKSGTEVDSCVKGSRTRKAVQYSMTNKRKTEYDKAKSSLSQQTVYGRQLVFALVASLHSIGIYCGPTSLLLPRTLATPLQCTGRIALHRCSKYT